MRSVRFSIDGLALLSLSVLGWLGASNVRAETAYLGGTLLEPEYVFKYVDLVIHADPSPVVLTRDTVIRVIGGSITVVDGIDGRGADGTNGQSGSYGQFPKLPRPGGNGGRGFNLTLVTEAGSPDPNTPLIVGDITILGTIDLSGGNGGYAGAGAPAAGDCDGWKPAQNGRSGGNGGLGGSFAAYSSRHIFISGAKGVAVSTSGGNGGDGGHGGGGGVMGKPRR